jgi:uncharacterized membrane protein
MISIALIHPMLVHFPIVLLITAVVMDIILLLIKKDLADRQCLPLMALSALLLGTLSAALAAIFGDMALDRAISLGFPGGPLETHETIALITIAVFTLYCLLRLLALPPAGCHRLDSDPAGCGRGNPADCDGLLWR